MDNRLPLHTLLSQAIVAFIIEFDNEFELRTPHRTSKYGQRPAPWLVSMAMWMQFLRFIPDEGIEARELPTRWGLSVPEARRWGERLSKWWGYIVPGSIVRPTPGGRKAFEVWRGLTAVIEKRWQERFGRDAIAALQKELAAAAERFPELPDYLPILGFGLWSKADPVMANENTLPALLSKVLLGFAVEFESQSEVSLAICANVLRIVSEEPARIRDLPGLAGVSKESIVMAINWLEKQGYATVEPKQMFHLTPKGREAREHYVGLVREIEKKWNATELRAGLERLAIEPPEPPPGTWRSKVPQANVLPHFPMVLHRGGYPDGA